MHVTLDQVAQSGSFQDWTRAVVDAIDVTANDSPIVGFPSAEIQKLTNNVAGRSTMEAASEIVSTYRDIFESHAFSFSRSARFLDFGCGWGRIARFLPFFVDTANVYGVDVEGRLVDACVEHLPAMHFARIQARSSLPFEDGFFDVVLANSVFSHLNQEAHRFYIAELARVLRPGALLVVSVLTVHQLDRYFATPSTEAWVRSVIGDYEAARQELVTNGFVFGATRRWQDYGLAFVTDDWVREAWNEHFDLLEARPGPQVYQVARRR